MVHKINDNADFDYSRFTENNGSNTVAVVAAMVDREVNNTVFTPNDPFFMPGAMLERMPSFQRGIIAATSRFAVELTDKLARVRGSSSADADLDRAAGLLKYSPNVWIFDFKTSLLPTASSEKQYRAAVQAMNSYNKRLSAGEATFERRADNLMDTLDRIAADIGSASALIDEYIRDHSGEYIDTEADKVFYEIKGKMYAYSQILKALQIDYADVMKEKQLDNLWSQCLESMTKGAEISHFFVINGSTDSQFVPNHFTSQGFYLTRARGQLREITAVLQN